MDNPQSNLRDRTDQVKASLAEPDIHQQWKDAYLSADSDKFFEQSFDYIACTLNASNNSTVVLDVGCGSCVHAIRLANRGFLVRGVDFSESALTQAKANVQTYKMDDKITIQRSDILSLPFQNEAVDYVLCWGVLMHIPDLEKAVGELTRILKPGGILVIGENNMHSFHALAFRFLRKLLRRKTRVNHTPPGIEHWTDSPVGPLLTRDTNMRWLIERVKRDGFIVKDRVPRQFTEAYVYVRSPFLKSLIHRFNNFWFNYIKMPQPAFGNLLFFQKEKKVS